MTLQPTSTWEAMSRPPISLCQLSFPDTAFIQDIDLAVQLEVRGLSVAESKITPDSWPSQRRQLRDAGMHVPFAVPSTWTILPPLGGTFPVDPIEPQERIEEMSHSIQLLADLGADSVMVCTGPAGDRSEREARSVVAEGLLTLAATANEAGTTLSIEPMRESFRPIRTIVTTLGETFDLLDELGDDSIGIVLDLWHMWDCPDLSERLAEAIPRIHAVQVADYRNPTRGPLDRVAAGEGIANIPDLLTKVRSQGYTGWYDLEVFSDDGRYGSTYPDSLWKLEPEAFARRQLDGFLECWRLSDERS